MKIALVHEWLASYAGSERVLEQLLACFPTADLFAVVDFLPPTERAFLGGRPVQTSFIQRLPLARKHFRNYLALMPLAVEQFDLGAYDLVISSSHAVAKGVLTGPDQLHISYVHSPMRYAWDLQHQYLRQSGLHRGLKGAMTRVLLHRMRHWDARSAHGVDVFLANSAYIARRIRKAYGRDAIVVPPPVDIAGFPLRADKEDFYLVASRLVPYKRVDLVVEAFAMMPDKRLVVVGDGPENGRVREAAHGASNIEFKGHVSGSQLVDLLQRARAFLFAAEEDFGIVLVEAQACGTPVIAFGRGGAQEIVADLDGSAEPTGLLFASQDAEAIRRAVHRFESEGGGGRIRPDACRANAMRFTRERFRTGMAALVAEFMDERRRGAVAHEPATMMTAPAPAAKPVERLRAVR